MAKKKEDVQKEFARFLGSAKVKFKRFTKDAKVLAKKSEKEILKASKAGKLQLDILSLNLQKEKLYYDIGKKVASSSIKNKLNIPELNQYINKIRKLEMNARKRKKDISLIGKEEK